MKPTRSSRILAASIAAALVLAACSSDDNDSSSSGATETTAAAAATTAAPATTAAGETGEPTKPVEIEADIVGTALGAEVFTQLAGLVVEAGLVEALRAEGPFTVFAPVDDAFAELKASSPETLDAVHADKDLLTAVLTYHVVPGSYPADQLEDGQQLETLQGETIEITKEGDTLFANGVEILATDVKATNGVIHVLSGVLVPPS